MPVALTASPSKACTVFFARNSSAMSWMYSPCVAVLGPAGLAGLGAARAGLHRQRQILDLRAGVVVVELAADLAALRLQERCERVAERRLPPMPDVQRPGGIRGDEFDHRALAGAALAVPVGRAEREDPRQLQLIRLRREMEVDEAGSGDLGPLDQLAGRQRVEDRLRQLPRVAARRFCQLQRNVGREIAVRGVARALDVDDGSDDVGGQDVGRQGGERGLDELFDPIFHDASLSVVGRASARPRQSG